MNVQRRMEAIALLLAMDEPIDRASLLAEVQQVNRLLRLTESPDLHFQQSRRGGPWKVFRDPASGFGTCIARGETLFEALEAVHQPNHPRTP